MRSPQLPPRDENFRKIKKKEDDLGNKIPLAWEVTRRGQSRRATHNHKPRRVFQPASSFFLQVSPGAGTHPAFPGRGLMRKAVDVCGLPPPTPRGHQGITLTATCPPSSLRKCRTSRRAARAHCLQGRKHGVSPHPELGCRWAVSQGLVLSQTRQGTTPGPLISLQTFPSLCSR